MTEEVVAAESGVVVGADGSEHGIAAVRWAAATAVAYGLPLTVLYARPDALGEPTLVGEPTGCSARPRPLPVPPRPACRLGRCRCPTPRCPHCWR